MSQRPTFPTKWAHHPTPRGGAHENLARQAPQRPYRPHGQRCNQGNRGYPTLRKAANLGYRRYYIQSALSLDTDEKREQEKRSLRLIGDSFKKIVIVNKVMKPYMDDSGILTMGLLDFLLDPDSLDIFG